MGFRHIAWCDGRTVLMAHGSITLHLFVEESLRSSSVSQLAAGLVEKFQIPIVSLGGGKAVAVNYTNTPVVEGMNEANLRDLEKVGIIYKTFLAELRSVSPLLLHIPSRLYNICAWLPTRETFNDAYIAVLAPPVAEPSLAWTVRFQLRKPANKKLDETVYALLLKWKASVCGGVLGGERFDSEQVLLVENDGFPAIECTHAEASTTFPWLDLYVRIRSERLLKKSIRSINFIKKS